MDNSTVINRLVGWSKWKLCTGVNQGFPRSSSFIHMVVDNSRSFKSDYNDADLWAMETDAAVKELPEDYNLLIRVEYISNIRVITEKLELLGGISKSTYYRRLNQAYEIISRSIEKKYCKNDTVVV